MILKVKTPHMDEQENVVQSWRFYDGVQGLHYTIYANDHTLSEDLHKGIPAEVQTIYHSAPRAAAGPMLFAAFHSDPTGFAHMFCNTECYLLNDNGKTIERLI